MADLGRILLADDEETFLYSTCELLRRSGYRCDRASNAKIAAAMLREQKYDLLIADIKMPGNAELELIRDLPKFAGGLAVILVTGYPPIYSAAVERQLPVRAYLIKPFDFSELLAIVRKSVANQAVDQIAH